ncbi:M55 family metallopeptidase [Candidatus Hodarchaeum mangrovi]
MRYLLMIDLEGASGIYNQEQCSTGTKQWYEAKINLTNNVNAVIKGIYSADKNAKIVVRDLHNQGYNIHRKNLPKTVHYIGGPYHKPIMWFGDLRNFDLAFMVGIHARSGEEGFQPHTQCLEFSKVIINGKPVTEVEFTASLITEKISPAYPIGFVSGENIAIKQVKESLPWVIAVQIQKKIPNEDFTKIIDIENQLLTKKARLTVENRTKFQLFQFDTPLNIEISYYNSHLAKKVAKRWKMTLKDDHQTLVFVVPDTHAFIYQVIEIMFLTPKMKFLLPFTPLLRPIYRFLAL